MQLDRSIGYVLRLHARARFDLYQVEGVSTIATEDIYPSPGAIEGKRRFVDGEDKRVGNSL
jgi:hypothetical protein